MTEVSNLPGANFDFSQFGPYAQTMAQPQVQQQVQTWAQPPVQQPAQTWAQPPVAQVMSQWTRKPNTHCGGDKMDSMEMDGTASMFVPDAKTLAACMEACTEYNKNPTQQPIIPSCKGITFNEQALKVGLMPCVIKPYVSKCIPATHDTYELN